MLITLLFFYLPRRVEVQWGLAGVGEVWVPLSEAPDCSHDASMQGYPWNGPCLCVSVYLWAWVHAWCVLYVCIHVSLHKNDTHVWVGAWAWLSSSLGSGSYSLISYGSTRCLRRGVLGGTLKARLEGSTGSVCVCLSFGLRNGIFLAIGICS